MNIIRGEFCRRPVSDFPALRILTGARIKFGAVLSVLAPPIEPDTLFNVAFEADRVCNSYITTWLLTTVAQNCEEVGQLITAGSNTAYEID